MTFLRRTGAALIVLAALALAYDVWRSVAGGEVSISSLGELWFTLAPGSLNLAQAIVQRYISPALWDPVIIWILTLPAWAAFGVPGALLIAIGLVNCPPSSAPR